MLALPPASFPAVNTTAVTANGYCFGGAMVLELVFGVGVGVVVAAEVAVIVGRGVAACGI
jgi:hypothetical protein